MTKKSFARAFLPCFAALLTLTAQPAQAKGDMETCKHYVDLKNLDPGSDDADLLPDIEFEKAACVEENGDVFAQLNYKQSQPSKAVQNEKEPSRLSTVKFGSDLHDKWCGDIILRSGLKNYGIQKVLSDSEGNVLKTAAITESECLMD